MKKLRNCGKDLNDFEKRFLNFVAERNLQKFEMEFSKINTTDSNIGTDLFMLAAQENESLQDIYRQY